ncbi:MAG: S24 family peptidase [Pseudomonadales bacterium]
MLRAIPIKAQAGLTGFESPAAEYVEMGVDLDQLLIEHPHATYIAQAQGESMLGDGIFDGDLLLVSRAEKPANGSVVVANLNGVFICKKLELPTGKLLSSGSPQSTYHLREGDQFDVEGVVIRSIRLHKPLSWSI